MKKITILLVLLLLTFAAKSQIIYGMNETLFIGDLESNELVIYETYAGDLYILQPNFLGQERADFLGEPLDKYYMHEGFQHQLRKDANNDLFILVYDNRGNIAARYLRD